ncbi:cytochrome P450 [Amycolatopsis balhimycina DSM 5908]|uniref:Cytochrome P450 n=1 Tax=Amycolatopsis balhimycina DSM 5908 TaxID=1081091 RepID=A0A428WRV5_AMYBA|nr:cytochrome P450 [Amycolatopsis balhimycina]RSM45801.1 cytochrome P450 [Amycolatopsis balhimycina DSM 5908]
MTETLADDPLFFPAPRSCPFSAPPAYTELRETGGLHKVKIWDGSQHWLATRHEDIRAVLGNPAFSADVRADGYPLVHAGQEEQQGGLFLRLDDPEHARLRRLLTREFSVKATHALRDELLAITDELIDAMQEHGGPVDFIKHFALPLPSRAICLILGVPYEDREIFQGHADVGTDLSISHEDRITAHRETGLYYRELIERKRREPGDDMISRLLAEDGFTAEDLPRLVGILVGAGHETTANMLGLGTLALLLNDTERERLRAHPELAPTTAEEMLRYWSIVSTDPRRVALDDVEIGGQLVRRGEGVIVSLIAGNRDQRVFGDTADQVDIGRNARQHVAFGFGTHQCLGQNLARVEMQVAWPRLFERIPDLRLAIGEDEVPFKRNSIVYGVKELPVTWGTEK